MTTSGDRTAARPHRLLYLAALLAAAGLAVAAYRVSHRLLTQPAPTAAPQPSVPVRSQIGPEVESHLFQVETAEGRVEAFREGKWIAVERGDLLTLQDLVRTGTGRAVLRLGSSEIELRERVEVRLDSISRAGANLDLRRGKVVARVGESHESLSVSARNTRTTSVGAARFVVQADDHGRVSVATTEGAVKFSSAGKEITVERGRTSHADPGSVPEDPEQIPESVLLSVVWPSSERHADRATLTGRVSGGAQVRVNGVAAEVAQDGAFSASVPLKDGMNDIKVEAEDLAGRSKETSGQVFRRPTRPPDLRPERGVVWPQ